MNDSEAKAARQRVAVALVITPPQARTAKIKMISKAFSESVQKAAHQLLVRIHADWQNSHNEAIETATIAMREEQKKLFLVRKNDLHQRLNGFVHADALLDSHAQLEQQLFLKAEKICRQHGKTEHQTRILMAQDILHEVFKFSEKKKILVDSLKAAFEKDDPLEEILAVFVAYENSCDEDTSLFTKRLQQHLMQRLDDLKALAVNNILSAPDGP